MKSKSLPVQCWANIHGCLQAVYFILWRSTNTRGMLLTRLRLFYMQSEVRTSFLLPLHTYCRNVRDTYQCNYQLLITFAFGIMSTDFVSHQKQFYKQSLTHALHLGNCIWSLHMLHWAPCFHRLYLCSAELQSALHLVPYFPACLSVTASLPHCFSWKVGRLCFASSVCSVIYWSSLQALGSSPLRSVVEDGSVTVWTQ